MAARAPDGQHVGPPLQKITIIDKFCMYVARYDIYYSITSINVKKDLFSNFIMACLHIIAR